MKTIRVLHFWKDLGLISRLMLAVGIAIVAGGGVQTALLVAEGAPEVVLAAEAFNNMANNIESLIASLGKSESKN